MGEQAHRAAFAGLLRQHRISARLTQEQLATLARLSNRTIGDLERGRVRRPQPASVRLLADALGLTGAERTRFLRAAHDEYWTERLGAGEPGQRRGPTLQPPAGAQPTRPAQLPPDIPAFTGRSAELAALDELADGDQPGVALVTGAGGVGKTALAVHWAYHARDRYPDGQLFASLHGYAAGPPARPGEVLARFLHALGVPAHQVPQDVEEAAALYRSLLWDRRMLVVLDNVGDPDHVRALLPGGQHCLAVVTSRDSMTGLVARDGARRLRLPALPATDSHQLLTRLIGVGAATADPRQLGELARLCGHLPLTLRIAAAILDQGHTTIGDYVRELRAGDRLSTLAPDDDTGTAVRAAFDLSYARLPPAARRLFRMIGVVPGPDVTSDAAAVLLDVDATRAQRLLSRLTDAHLLDRLDLGGRTSPARARFTCHDLLREYARTRAAEEETPADRTAALDRLYRHYRHVAASAAERLDPDKLRLAPPPRPACPCAWPGFADAAQALSWFDAEQPNLVAAIRRAAAHGPRATAWLLADSLRGYDRRRMHLADWTAVTGTALAAAQAEDEPSAQASAHLSLGLLRVRTGAYPDAVEHYRQAAALARRAGWPHAEAAALLNTAAVHADLGELRQSAETLGAILAVLAGLDVPRQSAVAMNNLGLTLAHLGQPTAAADHYRNAIALHREADYPAGAAIALANLAALEHDTGHTTQALGHLEEALALCGRTEEHLVRAMALGTLAEIHCDAGRLAPALEAAHSALALARESQGRRLEAGALNQLARTLSHAGETAEAGTHYQEALARSRAGGDRLPELDALIGLADTGRQLRTGSAAMAYARQALALAERCGYRIREGRAHTALARMHLHAGDSERSVDHANRAVDIHRDVQHPRGEADALSVLGAALGHAADVPGGQRRRATRDAYARPGLAVPN